MMIKHEKAEIEECIGVLSRLVSETHPRTVIHGPDIRSSLNDLNYSRDALLDALESQAQRVTKTDGRVEECYWMLDSLLSHIKAASELILILSACHVNQASLFSTVTAWLIEREPMAGDAVPILEKLREEAASSFRSAQVLKVVIDKHLSVMGGGEYNWEKTDDSKETGSGTESPSEDVRVPVNGLPAVCPQEPADGQEPHADIPGDRKVRRRAARPKGKSGG